jgi:hypothetical protein
MMGYYLLIEKKPSMRSTLIMGKKVSFQSTWALADMVLARLHIAIPLFPEPDKHRAGHKSGLR